MADWVALKTLRQRVLHLGEDMYPEAVQAEPALNRFRSDFNVLTLRYASPLHPYLSRRIKIEKDLDFNFVGHPYQSILTRHCVRKYKSLIRNIPPVISEPLRINSFRRSQVNLVFHAAANIKKGIIVERFAEALSMGGIIFHDHPRISAEFPNHSSFFYVTDPADIDTAFSIVMSKSEEERDVMRAASWHSWTQTGFSYFDQASRILMALGICVEKV